MKRMSLIFVVSVICVCVGAGVACYNTAAIGYDNANIISFYDGGVYVLDFDINYDKAKKEIKKLLPQKFITI